MMTLRNLFLPMTLGLALIPTARAGNDDKNASDKKSQEKTVQGVVSEVTVLGETDIDYSTGRAVSATMTYLTVLGRPSEMEESKGEGDKVAKSSKTSASGKSDQSRKRMNVYVLAIAPKTKVCECMATEKAGAAAQEKECGFDKLEIGDTVEVRYESDISKSEAKNASSRDNRKHGRHRIYFGAAKDIKIMAEPMDDESEDDKKSPEKDAK
ncbi:hypothetical protein P12x_004440 [Tundrisphaera lichenicola]|uniref:hypothetical protein n=1 Tax=Tundrisphaera lichenicola TaxID=2029860 RepID=UPI003EB6EA46